MDSETRARQRYLDLIVTPDARRVADVRTRTLAAIRGFLAGRGFTEVETPVLQPEAGGAARPFITHHNALDIEMYLRIALELHLKRLIVGGYEKVFEMSRVFRNEGIDTRHNPEFTMLEAYQALADYRDMMVLTEEMVGAAAQAAIGTTEIEVGGEPVSLAPPWRRATMYRAHRGAHRHRHPPRMPIEEARRIGTEGRRRVGGVLGRRQDLRRDLRRAGRAPPHGARSSSATTRARSRRWRAPTATTPRWWSGSRWSSRAASWPTPTAS